MDVVPPSIHDRACEVLSGVNPKPPAAVAARGLTPATPSKQALKIE
jgi:hypothetical protein